MQPWKDPEFAKMRQTPEVLRRGDFDIKGFIKCVQESGYKGPWGVEVIGEKLLSMTLHELTEKAFSTTVAQFDKGAGA